MVTHVQALLHGSTTHEFPAHVPPPQSLPLRLETLLATTTHHRQWLQHSALVLSDDATRACIAMDSQEGTPVHGADGDKSQVHGATDGGGGQGVHAETQGVDDTLCNTRAVQLWVLQCCQAVLRDGDQEKDFICVCSHLFFHMHLDTYTGPGWVARQARKGTRLLPQLLLFEWLVCHAALRGVCGWG